VENPRFAVDPFDGLFVTIVKEAQIGPKKVAREQRQNLVLLQNGKQQIEVEHLFEFSFLEKSIKDAGGFRFN
jgi:hypothetical protein